MFKLKLLKKKPAKKKAKGAGENAAPRVAFRILSPLLTAFFLVAVCAAAAYALVNSSYFRLKAIELQGTEGIPYFKVDRFLRAYQDRNLFAIDIRKIAEEIRGSYPDVHEAVVRRELPDRLSISVAMRRPLAFIGDDRYYLIDTNGVILHDVDASQWRRLPVISGVVPRGRAQQRSEALMRALELIKAINASELLSHCAVTRVDASDPRNLSFYLEDGVEIKIGSEHFKERLGRLVFAVKDPKLVLSRVKYIDLRFKDIVIGQKGA